MASASAMQRAMAHNSHESPLTSLVRRASSRRIQQPPPLQPTPAITFQYDDSPSTQDPSQYQSGSTDFKPPHSPLLHGHFSRDSYATASSYENSSYFDSSASGNSSRVQSFTSNAYPDSEIDYRYQYDTESAYGGVEYSQQDMNSAPALRDSWRSTTTSSTARPGAAMIDAHTGQAGDRNTYSWADDFGDEYYGDLDSSTSPPKVIATATGAAPSPPSTSRTPPRPESGYESDGQPRTAGRTPITKPVANFSRPRPPPPPEHTEEQKRQVLQRNLNRQRSQSPGSAFQSTPSSLRNQVKGNSTSGNGSLGGQHSSSQGREANTRVQGQGRSASPPSAARTHTSSTHNPSSSSSLLSQPPPQPQPPPMGSYQSSQHTASRPSLSPRDTLPAQSSFRQQNPSGSTPQQRPAGAAAPRVESTYSVYSNYSYYSYDTAVPSPTGSAFSNSSDPFNTDHRQKNGSKSNLAVPQSNPKQGGNRSPLSSSVNVNNIPIPPDPTTSKATQEPRSALDFLLLGIEHHEADRLNESARCFERSATEGGGCGVGMLMWGLTLRHGWGCPKNEKQAFKWLQRAAESAVGDLEATRARGIKDTSVVRSELVLAIYEVGQCFFQGWGVPKDQKMAFSYYKLAAELGDADAQMDVAFCLTNGKGCKKDKKEAAKWYRAAVKQGQSDVGLAWIYKDKYQ